MQIMADRTEQEAHAYCDVLIDVFTHYRDIPLDERTILQMHEELFKYSEDSAPHRGKYKVLDNKVETKDKDGKVLRVLVEGTPAKLAPQALHNLLAWTNKALISDEYHPLVTISAFLVEFLKIHPFVDGNGRVGRMLTNLLLLKAGYNFELFFPHEKIIENDKEAYYIALSNSQKTFGSDDESILSWTEYFLGLVLEQAKQSVELLADDTEVVLTA